jgi:hypothetical protein
VFRIERLKVSTKFMVSLCIVASMALFLQISGNAESASQNVSWFMWFMGQSASFEFHFLDLLELLSR